MPKVVPSHKAINQKLTFRISEELRQKIKRKADREGITEGEYLRRLIIRDANERPVML